MPIPQPTSRHDTISPAQPTARIFEYHVVAPLLLKMIDESHPHEIPVSGLYRVQEDQEDSEAITTGNDFLEDKSWDEINDESVGSYRSPLDDDYWSSNDYTVRSDFGDGGLSNDSSGSYEIQDDELDLNNKALNKTSWDKSSNMDDDRPSWDLGNGVVIGADA